MASLSALEREGERRGGAGNVSISQPLGAWRTESIANCLLSIGHAKPTRFWEPHIAGACLVAEIQAQELHAATSVCPERVT